MADAKVKATAITLMNNDYEFKAPGSVLIFDGYLIGHYDLIGLDLRNMSADIFRDESGFKNTGSLSVVDGVLTISGYDIKMEMQDPQLLRELLGL